MATKELVVGALIGSEINKDLYVSVSQKERRRHQFITRSVKPML